MKSMPPKCWHIAKPLATRKINKMKLDFSILLLMILLLSCTRQSQFDKEKETREILKLHNLQRDYHFNKDSIAYADQLSENYIAVNRGIISRPTKKETISKYNNYFSSVEFIKWDDVTEPIIRFSEDGKLAYTIVDKIVQVAYEDEKGEVIKGETHFAWTAIYKKYGDDWKIDCAISTNKPINSK